MVIFIISDVIITSLSYSSVCREQWIKAKYERKEFVHNDNGLVDNSPKSYITGRQ